MLRVDQVVIIRHKVLNEERSIREVARELGVSRNTVRRYVRQAPETRRRRVQRRSPKMDEVGPRIDALLEEWSGRTTKKQRITGSRVHAQLLAEGFDVGTTTVRTYLRRKRLAAADVTIPLVHRPGEEGQVDFFDVVVDVAGERCDAKLFLMSLPYSDRDYACLYAGEDLPSFLDGHVAALKHFEGTPRRLIYDNPKVAVKLIERWGERRLNEHFARLVAHYAFEPCFARVGEGHDKGAVEVRGKRLRLQHLVPIPAGESLADINDQLLAALDEQAQRRKNIQGLTVMERFREEQAHFLPLPEVAFDPRLPVAATISRQSTIRLGGATYSVPSHWLAGPVMGWVGATDIRFEQDDKQVVVERQQRGGRAIRYLHYVPQLARRPQAVRQVAPELMAELGPPWVQLWSLLVEAHDERRTGRIVAGLLGAVVAHDLTTVSAALAAVLEHGGHVGSDPERVGLPLWASGAVPPALQAYDVTAARATDYDHLLLGGRP